METYTVSDAMTERVVALRESDDLALAESILDLGRIRHLPVTREGELVGLVTHREILRACAQRIDHPMRTIPAGEVMVTDVVTASPDTPLRDAAATMLAQKLGCMPVVSGKKLVGIITEADLVRLAMRMVDELEEAARGTERLFDSPDA